MHHASHRRSDELLCFRWRLSDDEPFFVGLHVVSIDPVTDIRHGAWMDFDARTWPHSATEGPMELIEQQSGVIGRPVAGLLSRLGAVEHHDCEPPRDRLLVEDLPQRWTCPVCGDAWEARLLTPPSVPAPRYVFVFPAGAVTRAALHGSGSGRLVTRGACQRYSAAACLLSLPLPAG